ncbi:hypothetical protein SHO565_74000 [Streptomyces sp. HO565]
MTNTGPRVRSLSNLGSNRAVPASQYTGSKTKSSRDWPRRLVDGYEDLDLDEIDFAPMETAGERLPLLTLQEAHDYVR